MRINKGDRRHVYWAIVFFTRISSFFTAIKAFETAARSRAMAES